MPRIETYSHCTAQNMQNTIHTYIEYFEGENAKNIDFLSRQKILVSYPVIRHFPPLRHSNHCNLNNLNNKIFKKI